MEVVKIFRTAQVEFLHSAINKFDFMYIYRILYIRNKECNFFQVYLDFPENGLHTK